MSKSKSWVKTRHQTVDLAMRYADITRYAVNDKSEQMKNANKSTSVRNNHTKVRINTNMNVWIYTRSAVAFATITRIIVI